MRRADSVSQHCRLLLAATACRNHSGSSQVRQGIATQLLADPTHIETAPIGAAVAA